MADKKNLVLGAFKDALLAFLAYDRRDDEDLSVEDLRRAVAEGEVSVDELVALARQEFERYF